MDPALRCEVPGQELGTRTKAVESGNWYPIAHMREVMEQLDKSASPRW